MSSVSQRFFSHGKLLISGEYMVLDGARALAVPTKWGQEMIVTSIKSEKRIYWKTFQQNELWFQGVYHLKGHVWHDPTDFRTANYLNRLLKAIDSLNPELFERFSGFEIRCNLEFPFDWGLGSSATLIHNLSTWAEIDPYELNERVSQGSGYDIAVASSPTPIFYHRTQLGRVTVPVDFCPEFANNLMFVHLGKKQETEQSLRGFIQNNRSSRHQIDTISSISQRLTECIHLVDFMGHLKRHEEIIASVLGIEPVQDRLFSDFNGVVKSLGAWGGDFVLAASDQTFKESTRYFSEKGFKTVIPYEEMVLT